MTRFILFVSFILVNFFARLVFQFLRIILAVPKQRSFWRFRRRQVGEVFSLVFFKTLDGVAVTVVIVAFYLERDLALVMRDIREASKGI